MGYPYRPVTLLLIPNRRKVCHKIRGPHDYRFDIPKSKITHLGRNVILDMDFPEIFNYKVDREAPLPSGESVEKIAEGQ